jgi:hypothetical protein
MSIIQISKIQQRAGNLVDLPQLDNAQLGWATDARRLFIGRTGAPFVAENVEVITSYSNISFTQIDGSYGTNLSLTNAEDGQILGIKTIGSDNFVVNKGGNAGGLVTLGTASNVKITGGAIGYVLQTDGTGNLSWTPKGYVIANIQALSNATPIIMTVANTTPFTNGTDVTITGVAGANANTIVNSKVFYVKVANDYPTSGNVELYNNAGLTVPADGTNLTATPNTGTATFLVASSGGTAAAGGSQGSVQFNNSGVIDGSSNLVLSGANLDLVGTFTAGNIFANSGTISSGNLIITNRISAGGNIIGGNLIGIFANGNSSIRIPAANGNITMGAAGNATVVVVTGTGANISGTLSASGNITGAGLISAGGNITGANLITGGLITATGNVTGANLITGGLITAIGNITGANLVTGGLITAIGNITGANLSTSGTAQGGYLYSTGNISATGNIAGANLNIGGLISATGNITGANLITGGLITAIGNITGGNLNSVGVISAVGNITGANLVTSGRVQGGYIYSTGNISATGSLSVTGTATTGPLIITRENTGFEGGQLQLNKALDNNPAWYMDVYGNTGSPYLRFFNGDGQVRAQLDWNGQLLVNSLTATTGQITPTAGAGGAGIIFPPNPGGGSGDFAAIQYYPYSGEQTVLALTVRNDNNDLISLDASGGTAIQNYLTVYGGENVTGQLTAGSMISGGSISAGGAITGGYIYSLGDVRADGTVYGGAGVSTAGSVIGGYVGSTGTVQGAYVYSNGDVAAQSSLVANNGSVYAKGRHVSYYPQWGSIGGQFTPPTSPFGGIYQPPGGWRQGGAAFGIVGAYVYPPPGFSIANFAAGIVSNQQTGFSGTVDGNDTFVASFSVDYGQGRIELVFGDTESRGNPFALYMFWWYV